MDVRCFVINLAINRVTMLQTQPWSVYKCVMTLSGFFGRIPKCEIAFFCNSPSLFGGTPECTPAFKSLFSSAAGRQRCQFDRIGNFMKLKLDVMKSNTRYSPGLSSGD